MVDTLSAYPAVPMEFGFSSGSDAVWTASRHRGLDERDLAVATASGGQLRAVTLRAGAPGELEGWAGASDANFIFFYVIEGDITFTMSDGATVTLRRREVVHLPFLREVVSARYSADFLASEVVAPGNAGAGRDVTPLLDMRPKPIGGNWEDAVVRNRPELFVPGDGPRAFFTYRDLGTARETDRRIQIHDGDGAKRPMKGGTGWHDHSMSQFFLVLEGEATIKVDGHGEHHMVPGDAMMIGARMKHNVSSYSEGYNVFEVCMPADYDTIDRPAPAAAQ